MYRIPGLARKFGIALLCALGAHYGASLARPLLDEYVFPRIGIDAQEYISQLLPHPQGTPSASTISEIERILGEEPYEP